MRAVLVNGRVLGFAIHVIRPWSIRLAVNRHAGERFQQL